jgi:hypothetical protein
MKVYITQYSPEELQRMSAKDVRGLLFDPNAQNYSAYLKVCRKFEDDLQEIENRVRNEVRFVRPSGFDNASMEKAVAQHAIKLEDARKKYKGLLTSIAEEIVSMEAKFDKKGEFYTKYPVRGLESILATTEKETPEFTGNETDGEVEEDEAVDIYQKAEETLGLIENLLQTYSLDEKKEIQYKITTPLKNALKKKNEKIVKEKLALLQEILDKE